jgi:class 3 adenylate cyclase
MNVEYRGALQLELQNRNEIIKKKTEEAVNLSALSSQFSPQIVESIRSGKINLKAGAERAQICTMFIDIVNSTERVTRIDKDKVEKVLSKFLDDTIKTMLKYDITVDKFLGDGVLGFCNAPLKRQDFVSRVITAALEIREKIKQDQNFYERNWQKELQIRVGIAKGFANVGFYGSQKYFRSYTGIGPVMNMASRLCSAAEPSQIVVDNDVFEDCQNEFETIALGKKTLKGFEQDTIFVYEIVGSKQQNAFMPGVNDCPKCGSLMTLESNSQGHFIFTCKSCCSVITDQELTEKRDAA